MQRDQSFGADDRFIVTLDTFRDGRSGYLFQTNPLGALLGRAGVRQQQQQRRFAAGVRRSGESILGRHLDGVCAPGARMGGASRWKYRSARSTSIRR